MDNETKYVVAIEGGSNRNKFYLEQMELKAKTTPTLFDVPYRVYWEWIPEVEKAIHFTSIGHARAVVEMLKIETESERIDNDFPVFFGVSELVAENKKREIVVTEYSDGVIDAPE